MSFDIEFRRQGAADRSIGRAVGRLGNQVLIEYRINDGTKRARFLKPARYRLAEGQTLDGLPKYQRRECPGVGKAFKVEKLGRYSADRGRCSVCSDFFFAGDGTPGNAPMHKKTFNTVTDELYQSDC